MRFSIIIPTYNRARLVAETVKSALRMDYPDFEVIVVDDESTDDTESVLTAIHDPRFSYYRKKNGERAAARNFGAGKATGDYLNFFDSDDILLPNHLREARNAIEKFGNPEVFGVGFRIENSAGVHFRTINNLPDPANQIFLSGNPLGCNSVFVRRDIFEKFPFKEDRALAGSEDILLWLQLASRFPFRYWPSVTSIHYDHDSRSVYGFDEKKLTERNNILLRYLEADPGFMASYGKYLGRIRAQRHIYTAVHLAVSGYHFLPLKYLTLAARSSVRGFFHAGTAGTLKQVLLGFFRRYRPG
jgi:glycosyltransferase involved in cell wall biosynthesis